MIRTMQWVSFPLSMKQLSSISIGWVVSIHILFFYVLSYRLWCGYTTVCLFIHQLKNIWIISSLGETMNKASRKHLHIDLYRNLEFYAKISIFQVVGLLCSLPTYISFLLLDNQQPQKWQLKIVVCIYDVT